MTETATHDQDTADRGKAEQPSAPQDKSKPDDKAKDYKEQQKEQAEQETRKKRRPLVLTIGVVVVCWSAGGLYYWIENRNLESTDDAYTDGRAINIASQIAGTSFRSTSTTTSSSRRTSC